MVKRCFCTMPHREQHLTLKCAQCVLKVHTGIIQRLRRSIYYGNYKVNHLFIASMHFLEIHLQDKLLHKVPVQWLTSIVNAAYDIGVIEGLLQVFKMWDVRVTGLYPLGALRTPIFGTGTMLELLQSWDTFHRIKRERGQVLKNPTEHPEADLVKLCVALIVFFNPLESWTWQTCDLKCCWDPFEQETCPQLFFWPALFLNAV